MYKLKLIFTLTMLNITILFAQAQILESQKIIIKLPQVPEVPKPDSYVPKLILLDANGNLVNKDTMLDYYPQKKKVTFSNHVAPERFNKAQNNKKVEIQVGDIINSKVAAYLHSPLMEIDEVQTKLTEAGFDILSTFKVDKKGTVTSIVFTNKEMTEAASKNIRGFAGTLRLVLDSKAKLLNISNPMYVMKAFMQEDYSNPVAINTLTSLRNAFQGLRNSEEMIKVRILERYRFMENMPYYQDMKLVKKAPNKDLLARAKKSKQIVYEQHLSNGSIVLGVKLGKRTSKFVKKIGYHNSGLLPYPVLIENGEAKILAPQYYIAVMYPMLKMSQFMKIATVPGAISKDIDRIFR